MTTINDRLQRLERTLGVEHDPVQAVELEAASRRLIDATDWIASPEGYDRVIRAMEGGLDARAAVDLVWRERLAELSRAAAGCRS
jgi:hypothetical protein